MHKQPGWPLLGGLDIATFARRHWQRRPLLVRQAMPGVVAPLSRADLFALAARDDVESRLVVRQDQQWSVRTGPLPRRALPPLAQSGWTLLVQGLDQHVQAAHDLLRRFDFLPQARVDDLMLSFATQGGGVGPHWDAYDVFLLQVQGRRRWRVGPVRDRALQPGQPLRLLQHMQVDQEWVLEPGDMLYLPPLWAHDGVAEEGACMTASIGLRSPHRDELARALLARLADEGTDAGPIFRDAGTVAMDGGAVIPSDLQSFALKAATHALQRPGALERALGEWLSEPKPQVWFDAGAGPLPGADATLVLDRRTRMLHDDRHVYINGEAHRVAAADHRLLSMLADGRKLMPQWRGRLSPAAAVLIQDWWDAGWIRTDDR
ncbi:MAG: JmjC domain-containing protein [Aquabacterium sp.]